MSDENKIDDGGPAFPQSYPPELLIEALTEEQIKTLALASSGMSLRDWFAGIALQGRPASTDAEWCAEWCYRISDAMIAARKAKP